MQISISRETYDDCCRLYLAAGEDLARQAEQLRRAPGVDACYWLESALQ